MLIKLLLALVGIVIIDTIETLTVLVVLKCLQMPLELPMVMDGYVILVINKVEILV